MHQHIGAYRAQGIYPFHLPGHKNNPLFFLPDAMRYDITEIPTMDVLGEPTGFLLEWQKKLAAFFGADETYFLVNGASAGVAAAICAACREGDSLYAPRNGHSSMYNGLVFSGAVPRYFFPQWCGAFYGGVDPAVFDELPRGGAALVVSPTYEGVVSDVADIARRVHARGGILIVDEAHGAHFPFHEAFPASAVACGADIVVQSLHKTLPVPGQCAVLHVQGGRIDRARLRYFVNAMQTTSPSYMLMASADYALQKLWDAPEMFDAYVKRLARLEAAAPGWAGADYVFAHDRGKKVYFTASGEAEKTAAHWAAAHGIQVELAREDYLLAMTSVADTDEGFARLARAAGELAAARGQSGASAAALLLPDAVLTPRQAMQCPAAYVPAAQAVGRIAAELIAPCPPGIALLAPGERIPAGLAHGRAQVRVVSGLG